MASNSVDELVALERRFWDAMRDRDVETMASLTDEPSVVAGAEGVGEIEPASFAAMMAGASWTLEAYSMDEPIVRSLTDDTAIVAYIVHEQLTVDGEKLEFDAADSSTWVRRSGQWRCAMHTESILGDPFGRDRGPV